MKMPAGLTLFFDVFVVHLRMLANEHNRRASQTKVADAYTAELAIAGVLNGIAEAIDSARKSVS